MKCNARKWINLRFIWSNGSSFFSPGTSCRETSSNKRKYENDGACKLGPLDCLVYQEYVISFYHNYFVNSIDEGKFVASDCRVAW